MQEMLDSMVDTSVVCHSDICIPARKIAAYSFYIDGEVFVKELGGNLAFSILLLLYSC